MADKPAPEGAPEPVLSPCIAICVLDEHGLCFGCMRTGDEIAEWYNASEARKREIVEASRQRDVSS